MNKTLKNLIKLGILLLVVFFVGYLVFTCNQIQV